MFKTLQLAFENNSKKPNTPKPENNAIHHVRDVRDGRESIRGELKGVCSRSTFCLLGFGLSVSICPFWFVRLGVCRIVWPFPFDKIVFRAMPKSFHMVGKPHRKKNPNIKTRGTILKWAVTPPIAVC